MSPSRRARLVFGAVVVLALALWLAAVIVVVVALGRPSPPRVLAWVGSDQRAPEERGLEELLLLESDGAWAISGRLADGAAIDVARLDLAAGVARRDWPPPATLTEDDIEPQGLVYDDERHDLVLVLLVRRDEQRWLHALELRAAGGTLDLGRLAAERWEDVVATARRGASLEVLTDACRTLRFSAGRPPQATTTPGCPGADERAGTPRDRLVDGALGHFEAPRPAAPKGHADMTSAFSYTVLRASPSGLRRALEHHGSWSWCLEVPDRHDDVVCIAHDALAHRTRWTSSVAEWSSEAVASPRWHPAQPVLLPAAAGGYWLLDHSNVAADGRIYLRLDLALRRLDPLSVGERYQRLQPRSAAEVEALMSSGGPHAASQAGDTDDISWQLFIATLPLPFVLFALPLFLGAAALLQLLRRRRPLVPSLPGAIAAALYLLISAMLAATFVRMTTWL